MTEQTGSNEGEGGAPTGGDAEPFYNGFEDTELKQTCEHKGWTSAEQAVKSYRELERFASGKTDGYIKLPEEGAAPEAMEAFYAQLGRPAAPEGYELPGVPDEFPEKYAHDWFAGAAHRIGLSSKQANDLLSSFYEWSEQEVNASAERKAKEADAAVDQLQEELGPKFAEREALGNRAVKLLGMSADEYAGFQDSVGGRRAFEILAKIGNLVGSDTTTLELTEDGGQPGLDKAAAIREKENLLSNPMLQEALKYVATGTMVPPTHKHLIEKWNRVNSVLSRPE